MIRVFMIDDHNLFRAGMRQILAKESDLFIVGEAGNGPDALSGLRGHAADVILLDMTMPGMNGLDVLGAIRREHQEAKVLVTSMHPEDQYAVRVLKAGASGYMTKESAAEELIAAIRKVHSGGTYLTPQFVEHMAVSLKEGTRELPHQALSDREFEVLILLASGKKLKDIANDLCLSEKTITTYRSRILDKMQLHNNAELVHYAIQHKLIE
jgi:DNA-binding NarL/FixJ family response regulator